MLAFAPFAAALIAATTLAPSVATATFGWGLRAHSNWACSSTHAPVTQKQHCTTSGSFFTFCNEIQTALCCSSKTRIPPRDVTCPFGWDQHNSFKVCLPPKENCEFDCGEGYTWNKKSLKCQPTSTGGGKCSRNQWWHPRSSSCCPNTPPTPGKCPSDRSCPKDWYWCSSTRKCRPHHPRSPEPDCDNWSESNQCCMHNPTPSQGSHHKRERAGEQRRLAIDEVAERNAFYCPSLMTACAVASNTTIPSSSPEWAYECIDTQAELESCGGCMSEGTGQDCTAIAGAKNIGCGQGRCRVDSCLSGWKVAEDKRSCERA